MIPKLKLGTTVENLKKIIICSLSVLRSLRLILTRCPQISGQKKSEAREQEELVKITYGIVGSSLLKERDIQSRYLNVLCPQFYLVNHFYSTKLIQSYFRCVWEVCFPKEIEISKVQKRFQFLNTPVTISIWGPKRRCDLLIFCFMKKNFIHACY